VASMRWNRGVGSGLTNGWRSANNGLTTLGTGGGEQHGAVAAGREGEEGLTGGAHS
jgi:hypothetical protein